jgi:hypothetical protein
VISSNALNGRWAAWTENVSRSGALVRIGGILPVGHFVPGSEVMIEISLTEHPPFGPRCLRCKGVVVRSDAQDASFRVAVAFETVEFRLREVAEDSAKYAVM